MNFKILPCTAVIATLFCALAPIAAAQKATIMRPLFSFEAANEIAAIKAGNARLTRTTQGATDGRGALRVEFEPSQWPGFSLQPKTPWDWRGSGGLALDIFNPGAQALQFNVRVDDDIKADGNLHSRAGGASIGAGEKATFFMPFAVDAMSLGMRGLPTVSGLRGLGWHGAGPFDLGHIVSLQVFLQKPAAPRTLIIDNIRLLPAVSLDKIVDPFGQYSKTVWPGKLKNVGDLAKRRTVEEAALKAAPVLPERDRFGGWAKGPKLRGSGFFRTQKHDGKWSLVTPEGNLFFSMGVDFIGMGDATITTGREKMFSWLPDKNHILAKHAGTVKSVHSGPIKEGATFNFYAANLERKFGANFGDNFLDTALRRLPSWGFNTVGSWSDPRLFAKKRVPYTVILHIGGDHARVSSGEDYWGTMHDPFDPQFAVDVASLMRFFVPSGVKDPWCIGYFIDNELSWGGTGSDRARFGLVYGTLAGAADAPAKKAFLIQLKKKYGDIAKLNAAWQTTFANWDDLNAPFKSSSAPSEEMKVDLSAFLKSFALQYFRTVRDELKKIDANHLYLGCRFAWQTPEAVAAAAEVCDIVSFNIYKARVDAKEWDFLNKLNKPGLIGEFHAGALDRGMFHTGLVSVPSQEARGATYIDYVRSVLDHPALVGCHWFQYVDEPLTGRALDGENYNIGLVSVTDTPYPEMVAAAKTVHSQAYNRRYGPR